MGSGVREAEVLFTLVAERYERRSVLVTSTLVFSQSGTERDRTAGRRAAPSDDRCPVVWEGRRPGASPYLDQDAQALGSRTDREGVQ